MRAEAKTAGKSPADLLVLERFVPYRLSILSNRVSGAIARRYAKTFNLTIPEWRIIAVLGRRPGLTAKEVCEATEMDKVAVSRAVAKLVAAKRVSAEVHDNDGRAQSLRLTAQGETLHARIAPLAIESERRLLSALNSSERAQFDALIDRLLAAAGDL
ncbi:MAG: MarR family winged helix-turn-helix transcriptional regulator [Terricaulis sp.]